MTEGPLGVPRPLAETRCNIILSVPITIVDKTIENPEREIVNFASNNFPVVERNIYIDEPDVASYDFSLLLEQRSREPAKRMGDVAEKIENEIESSDWMTTNFTTIECGDPQRMMQKTSLPENIRNFFGGTE